MIEMLGVLAIVGVLSVGGIAGYSKAMDMYRTNKFTAEYNDFLFQMLQLTSQMESDPNAHSDGNLINCNVFDNLNVYPDGWKCRSNGFIGTKQGSIWIYEKKNNEWGIGYSFNQTRLRKDICIALLKTVQQYSNQLYATETDDYHVTIKRYGGDKYCRGELRCLRDITLKDMDSACDTCDNDICRFYVSWKY